MPYFMWKIKQVCPTFKKRIIKELNEDVISQSAR